MLKKQRIVILHDKYNKRMFISKILNNRFVFRQNQDDFDNYTQSLLIKKHLKNLGYRVKLLPFNYNLKLKELDTVFNIVETIESDGALIYKAPELIESYKIPFTGGSSSVIKLTTNKVLTKEILLKNSIPTPIWVSKKDTNGFEEGINYIFKPINEDASIGITGDSVFLINTLDELINKLTEFELTDDKEYFAEEYIDGREFNISIININGLPLVLPPAELVFNNYDSNKFKVACYKAKWDEGSFEYENTYRTFNTKAEDINLINEINNISLKCWEVLQLRGYARVDLRVDSNNRVKVLEINSNPCISIDSGFVAAAFKYGLTYNQILESILGDLNN